MELYLKYRPASFKGIIGQKDAVKSLVDMGKRKEIPHAILFVGPSGCGKTSIARILKDKLKCSDIDFQEINASETRGIDLIRDIKRQMGAAPLNGNCRVWLLDEAGALTGDAQNSFLKILEDTPRHVYFFLATTDPQKLKKTIRTRCTEIKCKELSETDLANLVLDISHKEEKELGEGVSQKIAEVAEGSARKALVILHTIIGLPTAEEQMAAIESSDIKGEAIQIARALMNSNTTWKQMQAILKSIETNEPESLRWMVLGYAKSVMLGKGNYAQAALVIEEFRENWYDCKVSGLVVSCWNIISA